MTREEEIKNHAYNNCIDDDIDDTSYSLIVETARWADETLIEKACKWLDSNFPSIDNTGSWYKEGFIKQFKKAMES